MGLKTTDYDVRGLGITVPTAYAQITSLFINKDSVAQAEFSIQQNREDIKERNAFAKETFNCLVDKNEPIYTQVYNKAKVAIFNGWEDDIVDESEENVPVVDEDIIDDVIPDVIPTTSTEETTESTAE